MTSDEVCEEYAGRGAKVTLTELEGGDFILVEGDSTALEFLGRLILAVATADPGCSKQLGPKAAGRKLFSRASTKGIYIHRTPCAHRAE